MKRRKTAMLMAVIMTLSQLQGSGLTFAAEAEPPVQEVEEASAALAENDVLAEDAMDEAVIPEETGEETSYEENIPDEEDEAVLEEEPALSEDSLLFDEEADDFSDEDEALFDEMEGFEETADEEEAVYEESEDHEQEERDGRWFRLEYQTSDDQYNWTPGNYYDMVAGDSLTIHFSVRYHQDQNEELEIGEEDKDLAFYLDARAEFDSAVSVDVDEENICVTAEYFSEDWTTVFVEATVVDPLDEDSPVTLKKEFKFHVHEGGDEDPLLYLTPYQSEVPQDILVGEDLDFSAIECDRDKAVGVWSRFHELDDEQVEDEDFFWKISWDANHWKLSEESADLKNWIQAEEQLADGDDDPWTKNFIEDLSLDEIPKLTRVTLNDCWILLEAIPKVEGGIGAVQRQYQFEGLQDEPELRIVSEDDKVFENSSIDLYAGFNNPESIFADDAEYELAWFAEDEDGDSVSFWDDDDLSQDEDQVSLTVRGEAMKAAGLGSVRIWASLMYDGKVLYETEPLDIELSQPRRNFWETDDDHLQFLTGEDYRIRERIRGYIEDGFAPGGEELQPELEDVSIVRMGSWVDGEEQDFDEDAYDDEAVRVISIDPDDGWLIRAENYGYAEIECSYPFEYGEYYDEAAEEWKSVSDTYCHTIRIEVGGDRFTLKTDYPATNESLLAGIRAEYGTRFHHEWRYDGDEGDEWLEDYDLQVDGIHDDDAEDPDDVEVTFENDEGELVSEVFEWEIEGGKLFLTYIGDPVPEGGERHYSVGISARAYHEGEDDPWAVAWDNLHLTVTNGCYAIYPTDPADLKYESGDPVTFKVGESIDLAEVDLDVRYEYLDEDGKIKSEPCADGSYDMFYDWSDDSLLAAGNDDGSWEEAGYSKPVTLTRISGGGTWFRFTARKHDEENPDDQPSVDRRFDFGGLDTSIRFEPAYEDNQRDEWIDGDPGWNKHSVDTLLYGVQELEIPLNIENLEKNAKDWVYYTVLSEDEELKETPLYDFDTEDHVLKVHGEAFEEEGYEGGLTVRVYANIEGGEGDDAWSLAISEAEVHIERREEKEEYDLPEDRDMLPGQGFDIVRRENVYVENADYPDGSEDGQVTYEVLNIDVEQHPYDDDEPVVLECRKDSRKEDPEDYWWHFDARGYGEASVLMTYKKLDGSTDEWSFEVTVSHDVYSLERWADDSENTLPGRTIGLNAQIFHDRDYDPEDNAGSYVYKWEVKEGGDYATLSDDSVEAEEGVPAHVELSFRELYEDEERIDENVCVEITAWSMDDEVGMVERGRRDIRLHVMSDYTEIWPVRLEDPDLDIGKSLTVKPEVRRYDSAYEGEENYILAQTAHYRWYYDPNRVEIRDETGQIVGNNDENDEYIDSEHSYGQSPEFTITRLSTEDVDISLDADWEDENDHDRHEHTKYHLDELDYECSIEQPEDSRLYSDGSLEFQVKYDLPENATLDLKVGLWNGPAEKWEYLYEQDEDYTFDEETGILVLDGSSMFGRDKGHYVIHAAVCLGDKVLSDDWADGDVKEAREDIDFGVEYSEQLPGWWGDVHHWADVWIENSEYPDGEDFGYEVLDVKVQNADPDQTEPVLDYRYDEDEESGDPDNYWWHITALRGGEGIILIEYRDEDGVIHGWSDDASEEPAEIHWYVSDDVWEVDVWTQSGSKKGQPGDEIILETEIRHHLYDPKTGEHWDASEEELAKTAVLNWYVPEEFSDWVTLEYPGGDENADTVIAHFAPMPDGRDEVSEEVKIRVFVTDKDDPDHVLAENEIDLHIEDWYLEVWPTQIDSGMWVGQEQIVWPELRKYPAENEDGYEVLGDVDIRWEYDDRAVEIEDNGDGSFTIRKKLDWRQDIRLEIEAESGEFRGECRDTHYHLDDCNYDVWYDCRSDHVYTDGVREIPLELNELKAVPEELYRIEVSAEGCRNEDDEWEPIDREDGFRFEDNIFYLDGAKIRESGYHGIHIITLVYAPDENGGLNNDDYIMEEEHRNFWVEDPWFEGGAIGDDHLFIGEERTLNGFFDDSWIRLFNTDYPDGSWYPYFIKNVDPPIYEEDPFDPQPVVKIDQDVDDENRPYWKVEAMRGGEAVMTVTLGIYDPETLEDPDGPKELETTEVSFRYWVGGFHAWLEVSSGTGSDQVLAGNELPLKLDLFAQEQDYETGGIRNLNTDRYEIRLENAWVEDIYDNDFREGWNPEQDPQPGWEIVRKDGGYAVVTQPYAPDQRIRIRFDVYDHDDNDPGREPWEICGQELSIEILGGIIELELEGEETWNPDMLPGQSVVVTPVLREHRTGTGAGEDVEPDDLYYRLEWHEGNDDDENDISHFEITDSNGTRLTHDQDQTVGEPPFTVKRIAGWNANLTIYACGTDRQGNEFEYARRTFYVNGCDYPLPYRNTLFGTDKQRGGSGYTWFYTNEEEISVWPDLAEYEKLKADLSEQDQAKLRLDFEAGVLDEDGSIVSFNRYDWDAAAEDWFDSGEEIDLIRWIDADGKFDLTGASEDEKEQIAVSLDKSRHGTIRLRTILKYDGQVLADEETGVSLRLPVVELEDDESPTVIGHPFRYPNGRASLYVEDADHCSGNDRDDRDGTWYDVQIVDIESSNPEILKGTYGPLEDGRSGWKIEPLSKGDALITYTYVLADEDPEDPANWKPHDTSLHVKDEVYWIELHEVDDPVPSGEFRVMLGETKTIMPIVLKDNGQPKPTVVDPSEYEIRWEYNTWLLDVDEGTNEVKGLHEGDTQVYVVATLPDETEVETSAWFYVHSVFADLDLEEEILWAAAGEEVNIKDLEAMFASHFTVTSITGATDDPGSFFFEGADDRIFTLDGFRSDRLTVRTVSEIGGLPDEGYIDEDVRIYGESAMGIPTWGSLKVRVHSHDDLQEVPAVEPVNGEGAGVAYWRCDFDECGRYFTDKDGTVEASGADLANLNAVWNAIDKLKGTGLAEQAAVDAAAAAYDSIKEQNEDLLAFLPDAAKEKLSAARKKVRDDMDEADAAKAAVEALPAKAGADDEAAVKAAKAKLDKLSDAQKTYLGEDTMKTLSNKVSTALSQVEKDKAAKAEKPFLTLKVGAYNVAGQTLVLKTKQKYNKITADFLASDGIASVKSSNAGVKVAVSGKTIKLTAGKKKVKKAVITVTTRKNKSVTFNVKVQKKKVVAKKAVNLPKKLNMKVGETKDLGIYVLPITTPDKSKFSSNKKKIVAVNKSTGVLTAKKKGKAVITLKVGKKKFKCKVTVK